jgi:hypothetical protein
VPRYQFQRRARAALLDQLAAAGLPGLPVEMDGDYRPDGTIVNDTTCWVTAAPEQFDAVAAVVAAHDAAALDAAAAATKQQDSGDLTKVRAAYQTLRQRRRAAGRRGGDARDADGGAGARAADPDRGRAGRRERRDGEPGALRGQEAGVSELAAQWPIVLLVMAVSGVFLRVIQQQYERMIANLEEDVQLWRDLALSGTDLASRMTSVVEHQVKRRP